LNYDEAYLGCCKYGLELVSIETLEEYNCLSQQFPSLPAYYFKFSQNLQLLLGLVPGQVDLWTSGSADGIGAGNSWAWCPSGTPFMKNISWSGGSPTNIGTNFYVKMGWRSSTTPITFTTCTKTSNGWAICEVRDSLNILVLINI
jgi:hypothetical protein